jgi:RNA polymerase sigma-70 factor, ECF subfamily
MASLGEAHEPSRLALFYTAVRRFMAEPSSADTTQLLRAWAKGDAQALRQLTPRVYRELRRVAARLLQGEKPGQTLQTADLVREAFLRLMAGADVDWQDRVHFFAVAAGMMRRILLDRARRRTAAKRGRGAPLEIGDRIDPVQCKARELIALDDALEALAQWDPRKAQIVELRFFGGLSVKETAEVVRVSDDTVMRDWQMAKAWLKKELSAQA